MSDFPSPRLEAQRAAAQNAFVKTIAQLPAESAASIDAYVRLLEGSLQDEFEALMRLQSREDAPVAVTGQILAHGVGYLDISNFAARAEAQFAQVLDVLTGAEPRAIILDVRGNVGGQALCAAAVAGHFVPTGTVVARWKPYVPSDRGDLIAPARQMLVSLPLAVLVDRWTASTGEILAGAFQDHGRAAVLGSPTFGKGIGAAVVHSEPLAIGEYVTPLGHVIQGAGIKPDIPIGDENGPDAVLDAAVQLLGAA